TSAGRGGRAPARSGPDRPPRRASGRLGRGTPARRCARLGTRPRHRGVVGSCPAAGPQGALSPTLGWMPRASVSARGAAPPSPCPYLPRMEPHVYTRDAAGWIEVVCGSMFSGKTEELIRRLRRARIARHRVEIFTPAVDTRYAEAVGEHAVVSQEENAIPSQVVYVPEQIL